MSSSPHGDQRAAWDGLIDVAFEALHGSAGQVSRLANDLMASDVEVDVARELAEFWTRAGADTARAFKAAQGLIDQMGSVEPQPQPQPQTSAGPAAATGSAPAVCIDHQILGPFRAADVVQPQPLRRRGDTQPSITSDRITFSPANVSRSATELQITVDCGGVPRGIYTGSLRVGADEYPFNIYLDPQ
ncbi:MAG TPA: hypothetical protein VJ796_07350 [Acidimicrobiia bacterium]|nr:hypothetical protein [Acidimicrobiia bacterium]